MGTAICREWQGSGNRAYEALKGRVENDVWPERTGEDRRVVAEQPSRERGAMRGAEVPKKVHWNIPSFRMPVQTIPLKTVADSHARGILASEMVVS